LASLTGLRSGGLDHDLVRRNDPAKFFIGPSPVDNIDAEGKIGFGQVFNQGAAQRERQRLIRDDSKIEVRIAPRLVARTRSERPDLQVGDMLFETFGDRSLGRAEREEKPSGWRAFVP